MEEDLKWIYSYVDHANEAYRKSIVQKELKMEEQQELEKQREKEREELVEKLRKV